VRVASLLPAATEIVAALGAEHLLVGVSHECDYPASVQHLPRVTTAQINPDASGAVIDSDVRQLREAGLPVIALDLEQLQLLAPDLILTQDLCQVCAVSDGQVHRLASTLRPSPRVLSVGAEDLDGIWADIKLVGSALGLDEAAEGLVLRLKSRLNELASEKPAGEPRVVCIEWLEPLYLAGHWVPQVVAAAGGWDVGALPGSRSVQSEWSRVAELKPDLILIMLCGLGIERSRAELGRLTDPVALDLLAHTPTWIIDGNAYTSRPGPRVVDGAALIQSAFLGRPDSGLERWETAAVCSTLDDS